jgi:hypothetical protein
MPSAPLFELLRLTTFCHSLGKICLGRIGGLDARDLNEEFGRALEEVFPGESPGPLAGEL